MYRCVTLKYIKTRWGDQNGMANKNFETCLSRAQLDSAA